MSSTIILGGPGKGGSRSSTEVRDLIQGGFAPHIGVVASKDLDEMLYARGFGHDFGSGSDGAGAFLSLIRPFGEAVSGKVTIRDSSMGSSRSYEDFGVRFIGIGNDEKMANGSAKKAKADIHGGNVAQIEELVDRHLNFAELRPSSHNDLDGEDHKSEVLSEPSTVVPHGPSLSQLSLSPFYALFLRRMLSGHLLSPHETFAHPVACVIAISSRNPSPIEEFKRLYETTNAGSGSNNLPHWVNNDFLRYYVLVHDDDSGDIQKSTQLYEQMKRHFGLHCHLLRLRSAECLPSDDDSVRLMSCEWLSAGEELANIQGRGMFACDMVDANVIRNRG
jgi:trafficking protein particle complex subunit 8